MQPLCLHFIRPFVERGRFPSLQHARQAETDQGSLTPGSLHRGGPRVEGLEHPPLLHPRYAGSYPVPVNLCYPPVDAPLHERGVDRLVLDRHQKTLRARHLSLPFASRPLSFLCLLPRACHRVLPVHEPRGEGLLRPSDQLSPHLDLHLAQLPCGIFPPVVGSVQGAIHERGKEPLGSLKLLLPNALVPDHAAPVEERPRGASLHYSQQRAIHDDLLPLQLYHG
mmetsp:Transcript_7070/g.31119  ORF Transcript_7070/g.31119 Transcript_7070/m.31119 type:complete len:224 (-) Transcript_7070:495-1166(-)